MTFKDFSCEVPCACASRDLTTPLTDAPKGTSLLQRSHGALLNPSLPLYCLSQLYYIILHYTILYYIILYYIILYYIILYYIILIYVYLYNFKLNSSFSMILAFQLKNLR